MLASFHQLDCAGKRLDLSTPKVMGVINLSSGSFSAVGRCATLDEAVTLAYEMVEQGAAIIDIGAEPTNPYVEPVMPLSKQMDKVLPVIERLRSLPVPISLDTSEPALIKAAADVGVSMINDVRALSRPGALEAVAKAHLPVCLMHGMQPDEKRVEMGGQHGRALLAGIITFLQSRIRDCIAAGIESHQIIVDPGLGGGSFGKTPEQNCYLLNQLPALSALGYPILIGASRKTLVYQTLNTTIEAALPGSLSAAVMAVAKGASIIRAHDVKETVQAVKMAIAILSQADHSGHEQKAEYCE